MSVAIRNQNHPNRFQHALTRAILHLKVTHDQKTIRTIRTSPVSQEVS